MKMSKKMLGIAIFSLLASSLPLLNADVSAYTYDNNTVTVKKVKEDANNLVISNGSNVHVTGDLTPNTGYHSGNPVSYNCVTYYIGKLGIRNLPEGISADVAQDIIQSIKDGNWNDINKNYPGLNIHVTNLNGTGWIYSDSGPLSNVSVEYANRFNYENVTPEKKAELDAFLGKVNAADDLAYVNGHWTTKGKCGASILSNWHDFVSGEDVYTITNPIWNVTGDAAMTVDNSQVTVDGNSSTSKAVGVQNNSTLVVDGDASYGSLTVDNSDVSVGNNLTVKSNGLTVKGDSNVSVQDTLTLTEGALKMEKGSTLNTAVLKVSNTNGETSTIGSDTRIEGSLTIDGKLSGLQDATEDTDATNYGQVRDMLADQSSETDEKLTTKANLDASNIGTNLKDGNVEASYKDQQKNLNQWGSALGTGTVSKDSRQLITGNTIYNEVRPSTDGTYISKDKTTGDNLSSIDSQVTDNTANISKNTEDIKNLKDLSNISDKGKETIKDLAKGSVKVVAGNNTTVSVGEDGEGNKTYAVNVSNETIRNALQDDLDQKADKTDLDKLKDRLKDYTTKSDVEKSLEFKADKDYVDSELKKKADTDLGNITDEGKQVIKDTVQGDLDLKANADASNVDANVWGEKLATGKIEEGDVRAVSGDTLYKALKDTNKNVGTIMTDKANRNLDNITDEGKQVIRDTVKGDMDKKADISYVDDKLSTKADTTYVDQKLDTKADKDYVDSELSTKANVDASNITGHEKDWADKLGVGKVEKGNQYLVTGDSVYNSVNEMIDKSSLVKSDGNTITVGKDDSASKVDISGKNGNRVLTGVSTDVTDATSAANVGYVNDVASSLQTGMDSKLNGLESKMTGQINTAGAQAAAMANLSYLPYEEGEGKYTFAAGVGNYGDKTATALGLKYYSSRDFSWNVSTTLGDDKNMVGAGVSLRFGPSSKKRVYDNKADKAKIEALEKQLQALTSRLDAVEKAPKEQTVLIVPDVESISEDPNKDGNPNPSQFVDYSDIDSLLDSTN